MLEKGGEKESTMPHTLSKKSFHFCGNQTASGTFCCDDHRVCTIADSSVQGELWRGGGCGGGQAHHPVRSQSECLFWLQVFLRTWTDPCAKLSNFSDTATVLGSHFHPVHLYLASQSPSMNFIQPGLMHWQKMCSKSVGESIYLVPLWNCSLDLLQIHVTWISFT